MPLLKQLAEDVAAASAAYLVNVLPEIIKLPASQMFERLKTHFSTAFLAYSEGLENWGFPEPSEN